MAVVLWPNWVYSIGPRWLLNVPNSIISYKMGQHFCQIIIKPSKWAETFKISATFVTLGQDLSIPSDWLSRSNHSVGLYLVYVRH